MARKFISIVKESQNQAVLINTKPTGIMGCFILREDNKEQKRHGTLLVHGKHINKRENLKGAVEILKYGVMFHGGV